MFIHSLLIQDRFDYQEQECILTILSPFEEVSDTMNQWVNLGTTHTDKWLIRFRIISILSIAILLKQRRLISIHLLLKTALKLRKSHNFVHSNLVLFTS